MNRFAVIDTETTWSGSLMTVGVLAVDAHSFTVLGRGYYIIKESVNEGGMYSDVIHMSGVEEILVPYDAAGKIIHSFLSCHGISSIFAYNASFDKNVLPYLSFYKWRDIMRLAAYKQYNSAITDDYKCFQTGKLKSGYGVENILRMLGKANYCETHNALHDAEDELEIMRLLGHPASMYPEI